MMITAYGDAATKRKSLEKGAEALLTKPIDFVTLRNEIEAALPRDGHISAVPNPSTLACAVPDASALASCVSR